MSEIEPALSAEEWVEESGRGAVNQGDFLVYAPLGMDGLVLGPPGPGAGVLLPTELFHATAALCLHGIPEGFTWEDVDDCRARAADLEAEHERSHDGATYEAMQRWEHLAARIAALLPPREP